MMTATHLHAMIVHFPIALLLVGFLSELIGIITRKAFFNQASFYLLILAAAGAITAYLTGDSAGGGMEGGSLKKAMDMHEQAAFVTLWLTIAAALVRTIVELLKKKIWWLRIAAFVLFTAAAAGVGRTGYLGGQLVYKHAAGVELGFGNPSGTSTDQGSAD
jgi:uncharacterized membrane protein